MEINRRTPDIEKVFNQSWSANNYRLNGVKNAIEKKQEIFNKTHSIKTKEEIKKEILERNSVSGQVERLEQQMKAVSNLRNNSNFR